MTRPTANRPARPRAFTLLEILIVVVIIGILSTLLLIGVEKLLVNARRQQTRSTLEQLRSMYAEYDTVAHRHFSPSVMPCPQNVSIDLNPVPSGTAVMQADDTTLGQRYGAAVWLTRDLMFNMRSMPTNAAALSKISAGTLMTMPGPFNVNFPKPYSTNITLWNNTTGYQPFDYAAPASPATSDYGRVYLSTTVGAVTTSAFYECVQLVPVGTAAAPNPSPAADTAHWLPAYPVVTSTGGVITPVSDDVPVLLDGWGNPIIFVPGGTLGTGAPLSTTAATAGTVVPNTGAMRSGTGTSAITTNASSPDGRPFFASAGPDGDFSNGDDNLYSFEK